MAVEGFLLFSHTPSTTCLEKGRIASGEPKFPLTRSKHSAGSPGLNSRWKRTFRASSLACLLLPMAVLMDHDRRIRPSAAGTYGLQAVPRNDARHGPGDSQGGEIAGVDQSCLKRFTISMAAMAASQPLFPDLDPALSMACSRLSVVRTPKVTGTLVSRATVAMPLDTSAAT